MKFDGSASISTTGVLGDGNVVFVDLAVRRALPTSQTHVFLLVIRPIHGHLRCRLPVNGVMQFVLHGCKKAFGRRGRCVVIQRGGVDVGDLLVELALRKSDFPDFFQLALKEFVRQDAAAAFEAIHIHRPTLNRVILHDSIGPLAKLYGAFVFDFEANGDDRLKVIVLNLIAFAIGSSC